jgi:hypothetical protein
MPSKRDPSRQRRQARNRAEREARAARREAASAPRPTEPDSEATSDTPAPDRGGAGSTAGARSPGPARRRRAFEGRPPGSRAAFYCLIFTLFGLGVTILTSVPVDADGSPYSQSDAQQRADFRDLVEADRDPAETLDAEEQADLEALEERRERYEELSGRPTLTDDEQDELDDLRPVWEDIDAPEQNRMLFAAGWPFTVVFLFAVGCGALAVVIARSPNPARGWMRLLIAMVLLSLLSGGLAILILPAVVALGIAHFQARRALLQAGAVIRPGAAAAGGFGGLLRNRRQAIDVEATETTEATEATEAEPGNGDTGHEDDERA